MTTTETSEAVQGEAPQPGTRPDVGTPERDRRSSFLPTWSLITTKLLELRRRRALMVTTFVLTIGLPWLVLGLRLVFHAVDPKSYGPAGSPSLFVGLIDPMSAFGFIIAATLGATAGSTDLTDGMFRHLVISGRSRIALYLARIPAGLAIVVPLVGVAFASLCLVTAFAGTPNPRTVNEFGVSIPVNLTESQLKTWLFEHPGQAVQAFGPAVQASGPAPGQPVRAGRIEKVIDRNVPELYAQYVSDQASQMNPSGSEMTKVGLWLELDILIGFLVGLGLGSLFGQRTIVVTLLIVLEIIVSPILASHVIPYFINGQRLFVGVAMDQLKPAVLSGGGLGGGGGHEPRHLLLGGGGGLGIPAMPTWAMVSVIVGWVVVWSAAGAWRMATRDA
jgi:hypothetical protein